MKKLIIFLLGGVLPALTAYSQASHPSSATLTGRVLAAKDQTPITGATLILKNNQSNFVTDNEGNFTLKLRFIPDTLLIRSIGYQNQQVIINETTRSPLIILLQESALQLSEVTVSTGYQYVPKERATGSFDFINNKLLNRSVGTNILSHIENLTPGLLFNKGDVQKTDPFLIRGRSTIFANAQPLIVLDNFPYDGDINNINPSDVESVTVLKDAAAASIWGARAANGVIVITTKKGRTEKPRVEFNMNTTLQQRPDLFNVSTISSTDYIELEKYLFSKGYYTSDESYPSHPPLTPAVELLIAKRDGIIPGATADAEIEALKQYDVRNDLKKYFYQTGVNQQYQVNVSGNTQYVNYYMSAGYDRNLDNLVGKRYDRVSLRTQNSFKITDDLQFDAGINYVQSIDKAGNNPGYNYLSNKTKTYYPYARLADASGNSLPFYGDYRKGYLDTAGSGKLLNWIYYPLSDINNEVNKTITRDYILNTGVRYRITKHLSTEIKYQYENQLVTNDDLHKDSSYFSRDYINNFTQIAPGINSITYPVPVGGIMDSRNTEIVSHQGRAQLDYNQSWNSGDQIAAIAGYEIRSIITTGNRTCELPLDSAG